MAECSRRRDEKHSETSSVWVCESGTERKCGSHPLPFPGNTHTLSLESLKGLCGSVEVNVEWLWFQILCLAEQIQFTVDVENAIRQQTLHQLGQELTAKLENYTSVNSSTDDSTGTQTPALCEWVSECVSVCGATSQPIQEYIYWNVHHINNIMIFCFMHFIFCVYSYWVNRLFNIECL